MQLHVHSGSEHTIDGKYFGAELHIVHQEINGDRYAVVGMMIDPASDVENEQFQQLLDGWQEELKKAEDSCSVERSGNRRLDAVVNVDDNRVNRRLQTFSPYDLLPEGVTYYHYDGGLTTPPCLEVVWWNVADKPVLITPAQYQQLLYQVLNYVDASTCNPGTNAGPRGITSRPVQSLHGRPIERVCPVGFEDEQRCADDESTDGDDGNMGSNAVTSSFGTIATIASVTLVAFVSFM